MADRRSSIHAFTGPARPGPTIPRSQVLLIGDVVWFGRRERTELRELRCEVTRLRNEVCRSIDDVQVAFSERDTELARALRRVADACLVVAGRIERQ